MDTLIRFQEIDNGSITIDGKDIRQLKVDALRSLFGVVTQEAILFNDSIGQNIAFGEENIDENKIKDAAITANAHDFISATTEGYAHNIGDKGNKLSGGQNNASPLLVRCTEIHPF